LGKSKFWKKRVQIFITVSISDINRVVELGSGISGIFCLSSRKNVSTKLVADGHANWRYFTFIDQSGRRL